MNRCAYYFNQLDLNINYELIDKDFILLKFSRDKGYLSYHDLAFMDALLANPGCNALSVCFDWGKEAFVLYDRKLFGGSPQEIIEQLEIEDALRVEPISVQQIRWENKLFQLFLNACASSENPRYSYNNLTGKLFITSPEKQFYNREDKSRVALEVKVMPGNIIQLDTVTFTSLARYQDLVKNDFGKECPKLRKKVNDIEKYVFHPGKSTFRRYFEGEEKVKTADKYVRMRPPHRLRKGNKKNQIDFLSLNPRKYPATKIALLNELLFESFEKRFGRYFQVEQNPEVEGVVSKAFKPADAPFERLKNVPIRLIDNVGHATELKEVRAILQDELGLSVRLTKKAKAGCLNLQFNHDQDYYALRREEDDPYVKSTLDCAVQNFTLQEFRAKKRHQIYKSLLEGHIKYDISQGQLSIFDWRGLQMDRDWYFAIADKEEGAEELAFHFLVVSPSGKLTFSSLSRDLFNQSFHELMADVFTGANSRQIRNTEGVIFDGNGNINLIEKTDLRTFPHLASLHHELMKGTALEGKRLKCQELRGFLGQFIAEFGSNGQLDAAMDFLEEKQPSDEVLLTEFQVHFKKKGSKKLIGQFVQSFHGEFGYWLKNPFKNKAQTARTFAALVDIHTLAKETEILFWANKNMGKSRGAFSKTNVVRRLKGWRNSKLLFGQLLDTMAVDFVRVDAPSVTPFPFKLLREYQRMAGKMEAGIDFGSFNFNV